MESLQYAINLCVHLKYLKTHKEVPFSLLVNIYSSYWLNNIKIHKLPPKVMKLCVRRKYFTVKKTYPFPYEDTKPGPRVSKADIIRLQYAIVLISFQI